LHSAYREKPRDLSLSWAHLDHTVAKKNVAVEVEDNCAKDDSQFVSICLRIGVQFLVDIQMRTLGCVSKFQWH
jgi:hypothetical protein